MIKQILKKGLLGMLIGAFINQVISIGFITGKTITGIDPNLLITQFFISTILGFYIGVISLFFYIEHWSLLKQTLTHLFALSIVYFPIAVIAKWMPSDTFSRITFVIIYILIYVIIWIICKTYWKTKIKQFNSALSKRKQ